MKFSRGATALESDAIESLGRYAGGASLRGVLDLQIGLAGQRVAAQMTNSTKIHIKGPRRAV